MTNDVPDGIKTIRTTENRLNMPQVTTETDVASLKIISPESRWATNEAGAKTRRASGSAVHRAGLVYSQITF
ncbi:hypothetical protein ACNKHX_25570 [Shigella flexneri]